MANLLLPAEIADPQADRPQEQIDAVSTVLVVASFGDPVAKDYAGDSMTRELVDLSQGDHVIHASKFDLVLFLPRRLDPARRELLERFLSSLAPRVQFVAIVSTFRVHLGDEVAAETETYVLDALKSVGGRIAIFRPGPILSAHSTVNARLRRFGFLAPLVPARFHGCCVEGRELFAAIDRAREGTQRRRVFTLLGPRRPWKEWLRDRRGRGIVARCLTAVCFVLSLFLIGQCAAILLDLLMRWFPTLRHANVGTLHPRSFQELLALCNPHNFRHIKVVGYNNGVVHFGHRFPGKTIVSTTLCSRIVRCGPNEIKADCGATIRNARDFLAQAEQELYVLPNYSYVCLGTAFFVPIHGSASDYATVAETITQVLLYDPLHDRFVRAASDEPAFRDHVYNASANVLLLRLRLRVKAKSRYYVQRRQIEHASAQELLTALRDTEAANVEIRKSNASTGTVEVSRYYQASDGARDLLEVPRDSLGRLWDRLEENAITSFLMHALTRWLAWHVELFFSADEFTKFWATHPSLPLRKIQLRYIRRDGLPCSPFREQDCVSVDMFMFRWNRQAFEAYLKQTFGVVRSNPGKHSQ